MKRERVYVICLIFNAAPNVLHYFVIETVAIILNKTFSRMHVYASYTLESVSQNFLICFALYLTFHYSH